MTVLILHGIGGHSGIHWQRWMYAQLSGAGYKVLMPDLPETGHPSREEWCGTVRSLVTGIKASELIIVGHSLSVVSALDFIESLSNGEIVKALISVAGFAEDYGAELNSYFLRERHIDFGRVNSHLETATVIYGDNDPFVPQKVLSSLAVKLNVEPIIISRGGHLNTQAGFTAFPRLLEIIKDIN